MGQILLSLSEVAENRLRRLAMMRGGKKGALSQTVEESLRVLEKEMAREYAWQRLKAFADQDIDLGIGKFDRNELYKGKRFGRH